MFFYAIYVTLGNYSSVKMILIEQTCMHCNGNESMLGGVGVDGPILCVSIRETHRLTNKQVLVDSFVPCYLNKNRSYRSKVLRFHGVRPKLVGNGA